MPPPSLVSQQRQRVHYDDVSSKLRRSRRAQARTRLICIVSHACPAPKKAYPQSQRMAVFERCGKESFHWWRCIDVHTSNGRPVCPDACTECGWTYVCTSREGKGKDMSVCMHSRSWHPSQQRIASHRRSLTRVPPASHSRTRQFCMERTMDLLYHIQLRTPSRPNGRPRQPFFQALLPSSRTRRLQLLSTLYWPSLIASSLHRVWQALLSYRLTRGTPSMRFRFVDLLGERRRRSKDSRATGSFISYWPGILECLHIYAYLLLPNDRRSKHPSPFPRLYIYFSTFVTIANPYNSFGSVFLVLFIISGAR